MSSISIRTTCTMLSCWCPFLYEAKNPLPCSDRIPGCLDLVRLRFLANLFRSVAGGLAAIAGYRALHRAGPDADFDAARAWDERYGHALGVAARIFHLHFRQRVRRSAGDDRWRRCVAHERSIAR